ncbi:2-hydroxyacid dehydrogenase [Paenibacillus ehimensis]|uniref:NAD(P)-dependent oxidoreductase n=1 Tax=Paenibacillus ehimensis TaxID=79264 RepID=A0ABT8V6B4_9BACL|nr:NAD(P)-dependent oxidoreductase [Paenibacillus ehimensis]MDO3676990.1 NAD(P)-dependent oxidoreductase [Paenibacillus ehimensis]MEC0208795.1 NAD(P)-dependent oxidoreductase [Paenibacillus ehimensis]
MRIVYLDEPTYLPDDFVREMEKLGEFEVYDDRPDIPTAVQRLSQADIAIVEWTRLREIAFGKLQRLKHIALVMTGYDLVDIEAAGAAGISVSNCPTYSAQSVAEHVFALLLAANRRIIQADRLVRQGESHVYGPFLASELAGRTLGLIGTGRIGQAVARIARGFGMHVIGANRSGRAVPGVEAADIREVMRRSDVVSLHVPFHAKTKGMITSELLTSMKRTALFINTSRGGLVDEEALFTLLRDGKIAGAGLDDVTQVAGNPLYRLDNVVFTPGTAWYTDTAREANMTELLETIRGYINGTPRNIVNADFLVPKRPESE